MQGGHKELNNQKYIWTMLLQNDFLYLQGTVTSLQVRWAAVDVKFSQDFTHESLLKFVVLTELFKT